MRVRFTYFSTSNHNLIEFSVFPQYIVLYLCSTSNHNLTSPCDLTMMIVLYLCSTSNHNRFVTLKQCITIVLYLCSTSNHNFHYLLYICNLYCLIPLFYIKPQPIRSLTKDVSDCLIPLFYIKPQQGHTALYPRPIVLYLCSTSNHNL